MGEMGQFCIVVAYHFPFWMQADTNRNGLDVEAYKN